MVLMDIRDRIGRMEFEFLVEKKMGTENKDNLLLWLMDLFPPESTDPSLQQVPEPQALPEQPYIPEPIAPVEPGSSTVEVYHHHQSRKSCTKSIHTENVHDFEASQRAARPFLPDSDVSSLGDRRNASMSVQIEPLSSEVFPDDASRRV